MSQDKECYLLTATGDVLTGEVAVYRYPATGLLDIEAMASALPI